MRRPGKSTGGKSRPWSRLQSLALLSTPEDATSETHSHKTSPIRIDRNTRRVSFVLSCTFSAMPATSESVHCLPADSREHKRTYPPWSTRKANVVHRPPCSMRVLAVYATEIDEKFGWLWIPSARALGWFAMWDYSRRTRPLADCSTYPELLRNLTGKRNKSNAFTRRKSSSFATAETWRSQCKLVHLHSPRRPAPALR
jgi:hypothetical protein